MRHELRYDRATQQRKFGSMLIGYQIRLLAVYHKENWRCEYLSAPNA